MTNLALWLLSFANVTFGFSVATTVIAFTGNTPAALLAGEMSLCFIGWVIYSVLCGVLPASSRWVGSPENPVSDPSTPLQ